MLPGIVTFVRLVQPENAKAPKLATPSGIGTSARFPQDAKAPFPTAVTLLGIRMLFRLMQPEKA